MVPAQLSASLVCSRNMVITALEEEENVVKHIAYSHQNIKAHNICASNHHSNGVRIRF